MDFPATAIHAGLQSIPALEAQRAARRADPDLDRDFAQSGGRGRIAGDRRLGLDVQPAEPGQCAQDRIVGMTARSATGPGGRLVQGAPWIDSSAASTSSSCGCSTVNGWSGSSA